MCEQVVDDGAGCNASQDPAGLLPASASAVLAVLVRQALRDDWTACAARRRVAVSGAPDGVIRRVRARLLRGGVDRPGLVGRRALLATEVALAQGPDGHWRPDVDTCTACRSLRCGGHNG